MSQDISQRFIFEKADIRGNVVQLSASYQEITEAHDYEPVVKALLGEFLVAASLLSQTIKFEGRLTLQARTTGALGTLMAEASHDGKVRAIARPKGKVADASFTELMKGGALAVTIEPDKGESYQSMVPLQGDCLAACLMFYFKQSEQLETFLMLSADDKLAAGMLLQQLPAQLVTDIEPRANDWQHVTVLAQTTKTEELQNLEADVLLNRLFADDQIRLFEASDVLFYCSCSIERMAKALVALDAEDLDSAFEDQEELTISCEFCQSGYAFTRDTLSELVRGDTALQ